MHPALWIKYLFGHAEAIRRVAGSRAALWTGMVLVLLTSIPRNYDQTLLSEKPFLWIFGPLLFSLVSGTWLYLAAYEWCARRRMAAPGDPKPKEDGGWLSFMGLFWMTAPVAWLYAIPVERFLDSITATHANVALLALVSLWRVLLMARVLQVTTKAPFVMALCWVLFAASVEVLVVSFFGGGFVKAIMASMAGMRNSPEEEIMRHATDNAFGAAFCIAPVALMMSIAWRPDELLQPLPRPVTDRMCWGGLAVAAAVWVALAVLPQRELAKTVAVERLMAAGRTREALDFLAARQPGDFAPARPLPPKPFERTVFTELPACFGAMQTSDPAWVRALLLSKLDVMMTHTEPRGSRSATNAALPRSERVDAIVSALRWHGPDAANLIQLLDGLLRFPEGHAWLAANSVFVEAIWQASANPESLARHNSAPETEQQADGIALTKFLKRHFHSDGTTISTNPSLPQAAPLPP